MLGREVESRDVFVETRGRSVVGLLEGLVASPEYGALVGQLAQDRARGPELSVARGLEVLKLWAERRLPLAGSTLHLVRAARNWPALHAALISDPQLGLAKVRGGLDIVAAQLVDFSRREDMRGHVDEATPGFLRGWALDLNASREPVSVEVTCQGRTLLETFTGASRPDVARRAGGDGRAGFSVRTSLLESGMRDLEVRIGSGAFVLSRISLA